MNLQQLRTYCKGMIDKHPHLTDEIRDLFSLAVSEIEEGGSETHECHLAYEDINELVNG
jgi:hypothetical protein